MKRPQTKFHADAMSFTLMKRTQTKFHADA